LTNIASRTSCPAELTVEDERKLIENEIRTHGGNYHPDLSRQCTHLLCASSSGKKYEAALKWGTHCVGVEWLSQSIERGMALESKYFGIDIEPERRGQGAWDRDAALRLSAPAGLSILSLDKVVPTEFENGVRKRRLRRAGSKIAQEGIWEGILGGVTDTQAIDIDDVSTEMEQIEHLPMVSLQPPTDTFGIDLPHDPMNGLFDNLIFYTWGFTEQKVLYYKNRLIIEKHSRRRNHKKRWFNLH
jgi:DNA replication regulator DPB11